MGQRASASRPQDFDRRRRDRAPCAEDDRGRVGAVCSFIGTVRDRNDGSASARMELEHYPGMTEKAIEQMIDEACGRFDIRGARVIHRVGPLAAAVTRSCWWWSPRPTRGELPRLRIPDGLPEDRRHRSEEGKHAGRRALGGCARGGRRGAGALGHFQPQYLKGLVSAPLRPPDAGLAAARRRRAPRPPARPSGSCSSSSSRSPLRLVQRRHQPPSRPARPASGPAAGSASPSRVSANRHVAPVVLGRGARDQAARLQAAAARAAPSPCR